MTHFQIQRFLAIVCLVGGLTLVAGVISSKPPYPAQAQLPPSQRPRVREVAPLVYAQLPDLPQENHYVNETDGVVDPENTLVARLVRYHLYVQLRPLQYRLDWKLTLADYLGVNEQIDLETYPGARALQTNPLMGDRQVISQLSRSQRDRLVETLTRIFNPEYARFLAQQVSSQPSPRVTDVQEPVVDSPSTNPNLTPLPQLRGADLLSP